MTIIFQHIPKTAGSSFHSVLGRQYPKRSTYNVFGGNAAAPEIQGFCQLPATDRDGIQLLKGHMPFGLHAFLASPVRYIGFLRDPVQRVISQYHYILANPDNPKFAAVSTARLSLSQFVESGVVLGMNNGHVRFLTGDVSAIPYGRCDDDLLAQAIRNVEQHYAVLGLTERFDESVLVMHAELGWKRAPFYVRQNVSKTRPRAKAPTAHELRVIEEFNSLDLRLYAWANERLTQKITAIADFTNRLSRFRQQNTIYSFIGSRFGW